MRSAFTLSVVRDGRLVARLAMLTQRYGCDYTSITSARGAAHPHVYYISIDFVGNDDALRRLKAQITKILEYEKELV